MNEKNLSLSVYSSSNTCWSFSFILSFKYYIEKWCKLNLWIVLLFIMQNVSSVTYNKELQLAWMNSSADCFSLNCALIQVQELFSVSINMNIDFHMEIAEAVHWLSHIKYLNNVLNSCSQLTIYFILQTSPYVT